MLAKLHFLHDPLKANVFFPNSFPYILPKKSKTNFYWQLMGIILCLKQTFTGNSWVSFYA